jgi:hypothetical protein
VVQISGIFIERSHPVEPLSSGATLINKSRTRLKLVIHGEDEQGKPYELVHETEFETTNNESEHLAKLLHETATKLQPPKHQSRHLVVKP